MTCRRVDVSRLAVVVMSAAALATTARGQTWTGTAGDGGNWNNAANWSPATVPNSPTADAMFAAAGAGNVSLQDFVSARSLTFTNPTGSFNLISSTAIINNLLTITVGPSVTGTETINLGNIPTGSLLFPFGSTLTVTNNSTATGTTLVIGPNTVIGTPGTGGVTIGGTGATLYSGSFATGSNAVAGPLLSVGPGTLTFRGSGTNLQGGLALNGGTLVLDYSTSTATKLGSGALRLSGGVLQFNPNTTTGVTQTIPGGTTFAAGHTDVLGPATGTSNTLALGALNRAAGATTDLFVSFGPTFAVTTSTPVTNGLLGTGAAFATVNGGSSWATLSGGNVVPVSSFPGAFTPGANPFVDGVESPSPFTTNSLYFNSFTNPTLILSGSNTLQSGGILVPPTTSSTTTTITGGVLNSGIGEIIVHNYASLTINSSINAALTKTGTGMLTLGGFGPAGAAININRGSLRATDPDAVAFASAINFNDNRPRFQFFILDFGNGVASTLNPPIQFAAYTSDVVNGLSNVVSTGASENSRITFGGGVGSAPGAVSPIVFSGRTSNTSGFNLTAVNTFTGDVRLEHGFLGIASNASLGSAANTLFLGTGDTASGGLEFLAGGIDLSRRVVILSATRVISNGSDVNTISGPVSGTGPLIKDGTGTLVLAGANTQSGLTINAGTVRVAADSSLGAAGAAISIHSGATLAVTGSFTVNRAVSVGPLPGNAPGDCAINVALGQVLTLNGPVTGAAGGLLKSGAGLLALGNLSNDYPGGTTVQQGTVIAAQDASLGAAGGPVTVAGAGTLVYSATTSTARTFNLNTGTLTAPAGVTVTLTGANVFGGFLRGPGTFSLTGGTAITGSTTFAASNLTVTGTASLVNFSNGGTLSVTAGPLTLNGFTHEGSGLMTVSAGSQVTAAEFQTYGVLTLSPNTTAAPSQLNNAGATPLFFNGGSRTFIATPATAGQFAAGVDLHGQNAIVAGGLLVNNGFIIDSTAGSPGRVIADFGSLVKGAGFFQNPVITQNGGRFQAGNSPGRATFGSFAFGHGGVNDYVFAINDATGTAGPIPDADGQVSGWGSVQSVAQTVGGMTTSGDFAWTADATHRLTVALETLTNPTTAGTDVAGPMAHFDPDHPYAWPAVTWAGSYTGPADSAALDAATTFDTTGFANSIAGTFAWSLDLPGQTLSLTYTPVPEPGSLALVGVVAGAIWLRRRR